MIGDFEFTDIDTDIDTVEPENLEIEDPGIKNADIKDAERYTQMRT